MTTMRLRGFARATTTSVLLLASFTAGAIPQPAAAAPQVPVLPLLADDPSTVKANELSTIFVAAVAEMLADRPSGKKSARENAYAALVAMWIAACGAGAGNVTGLTTLGGGVGAAIGGVAGAALGTAVFPAIGTATGGALGAGVGTPIGSGAGFFAGTNLTAAEFVALGIVTMLVVDRLEDKYPETAALAPALRGDATVFGYLRSSANRAAWASMETKYAGVYESMFVNLVDISFSDKIFELADKWQSMPGLTEAQKAKLGEMSGLRRAVQKLAFVKRNHKVAPSARPAAPLPSWMVDAHAVLVGDSPKVRKAWIDALGIGELSVDISGGKLSIKTSNQLKDVGTPAMIEVDLPKIEQSISALGNTLKASLSLECGHLSVSKAELVESGPDAGLVRIKLGIGSNAVLAKGSLSYSGPVGNASVDAKIKTTSAVTISVYLKFAGNLLAPSRIDVGGLSVASELGGVPGPINAAANDLRNKMNSAAAGAFDKAKLTDGFSRLAKDSIRALAKTLVPDTHIDTIKTIDAIEFRDGKLRVSVSGKKVGWPALADAATAMAALRDAARAPSKPAPVMGKPGNTTPAQPVAKPSLR